MACKRGSGQVKSACNTPTYPLSIPAGGKLQAVHGCRILRNTNLNLADCMIPYKEIGECLITLGSHDYFFRPSFANMARIGEPQEIVQAFYHLHNDEFTPLIAGAVGAYGRVPKWMVDYLARPQFSKQAIYAAMNVLAACCEEDITPLIGELIPGKTGKWTFVYRAGKMPLSDMVLIAQSLITHGIIGKAKVRQLQRHESGQATTEFRAFDYIS